MFKVIAARIARLLDWLSLLSRVRDAIPAGGDECDRVIVLRRRAAALLEIPGEAQRRVHVFVRPSLAEADLFDLFGWWMGFNFLFFVSDSEAVADVALVLTGAHTPPVVDFWPTSNCVHVLVILDFAAGVDFAHQGDGDLRIFRIDLLAQIFGIYLFKKWFLAKTFIHVNNVIKYILGVGESCRLRNFILLFILMWFFVKRIHF